MWYTSGDARLRAAVRDVICAPDNEVFLSAVPTWKAVVKHGLGKLPLPEPAETYLPTQRERHEISSLPALHRDPFDKMLVCQAHGLAISTVDEAVLRYPVAVL